MSPAPSQLSAVSAGQQDPEDPAPQDPAALSHRYRDPHMLRCPPGSCGSRPHPSPICWTLGPTPKRATTWLRDSGHVA